MKKLFASIYRIFREYRNFKKTNKPYKIIRYAFSGVGIVYLSILLFPQILFAHQVSHNNLDVYARNELNKDDLTEVLASAEKRLMKSPIYDENSNQRIFMTGSHGLYKFFTISDYSFASTIPIIENIRINKIDLEKDLVLRNTEKPNQRSLSGVIAHEVMHNQISRKYGPAKYLKIPTWKDEGYSEYIAGQTTLSFEEGVKLWKLDRKSPHLAYFKYHQMVKYILEVEKVSVEELFEKDFDQKELEQKVFNKICQN
jgi:hypothetical protein